MKMEGKKFDDRPYQTFFIELGKEKNIIACLPTGSGKTYIALELARHYLGTKEESQKVIFLANTITLVNQQAKAFSSFLSSSYTESGFVECVTSHRNVDDWKSDQWTKTLKNSHVMVMTTQILLNALNSSFISWNDIVFLILDECHHCGANNHGMSSVMSHYREQKLVGNPVPRILGLTATIINGKGPKKNSALDVESEVEAAEKRLDSIAVTYHKYEDVLKHSTSAKIGYIDYSLKLNDLWSSWDSCLTDCLNEFQSVLAGQRLELPDVPKVDHPTFQLCNCFEHKNPVKNLKSIINDVKQVYEDLGPYCARLAVKQRLILIEPFLDDLPDELSNLYRDLMATLKTCDFLLESMMGSQVGVSHLEFITDKVKQLLEEIKKMWSPVNGEQNSNELCGIIFMQRRLTTQALAFYLQDLSKEAEFDFLKVDFVTGTSNFKLDPEAIRVTAKKQEQVIADFRAKKINLLVATNVIEEGLDVPACNLVMRFDEITTYPSYVQSMGRARKPGSKFLVFVNEDNQKKLKEQYEKFNQINQKLADHLKEKGLHADEEEEDQNIMLTRNIIRDFKPGQASDSARITATDCISIVMRYCQTLPCDRHVSLAPTSWHTPRRTVEGSLKYKAFIKFPLNSVIREIVEVPFGYDYPQEFDSKMDAKRSVCMYSCELLYQRGALDKRTLLPIPYKELVIKNIFMDSIVFEKDDKGKKVGTKKRTQQYKKKLPDVMKPNQYLTSMSMRMYCIKVNQFTKKDDQVSSIYNKLSERQVALGLFTYVDLDKVPPFLIDVNSTIEHLQVSLKQVEVVNLKNYPHTFPQLDEVEELSYFEDYIFDELLHLKKDIMSKSNFQPIYLVPLKKIADGKCEINWELIQNIRKVKEQKLEIANRSTTKNFVFKENEYEDAVVMPWYTQGTNKLHVVLNVDWTKNPLSPFPKNYGSENFKTHFEREYSNKIDCIYNVNQPLIRVKEIGKNLNFLTSKRSDSQLSKEEKKVNKKNGGLLEFIPSLCVIHPLPASLYIESKFVPTILQRITRYLCALEIQTIVSKGNFFKDVTPNNDSSFFDDVEYVKTGFLNVKCNENVNNSDQIDIDEPLDTMSIIMTKDIQMDNVSTCNREDTPVLVFSHPSLITPEMIQRVKQSFKNASKKLPVSREKLFNVDFERETDIELLPFDQLNMKSFGTSLVIQKNEQPPSLFKIMEAMTMAGSGDVLSLERLETIGDSFLKFTVSKHLFIHFPNMDEGHMTLLRSKLVSNALLYQYGKRFKLGEYLAGGVFVPEATWVPLTYSIPQNISEAAARNDVNEDIFIDEENPSSLQDMSGTDLDNLIKTKEARKSIGKMPATTGYVHSRISDKSIADCVESLLGAYYTSNGIAGGLMFMESLGLQGPTANGSVPSVPYGDISQVPKKNFDVIDPGTESVKNYLPNYRQLESIICYQFKDPWLLVEAFSHPGYMRNRKTDCYQRLEFLGDAVLDFLITDHIYNSRPLSPGDLTDLRSALVNNITFASLVVRYGFHSFFLHSDKRLNMAIETFVYNQKQVRHEVVGHFKLLSDFDCPTMMIEDIDVPKILGDIFESLAGALYVDCGMNLDIVWKVFYRLMKHEIDIFSASIPKTPVRVLQETFGSGKRKLFSVVKYEDLENEQKDIAKDHRFTYVALTLPIFNPFSEGSKNLWKIIGAGENKLSAKMGAAKFALKYLPKAYKTSKP